METFQNEHGQTLIRLTQEEWANYGAQAGFTQEKIEKQASVSQGAMQKIAEIKNDIEFHQKEINEKLQKRDAIIGEQTEASTEEEVVEASNDPQPLANEFNKDNYPNLLAQEEQDGLIGPFTKTSPCV